MTKTVATSGPTTKAEIKALSREDLETQIDVSVASTDSLSVLKAKVGDPGQTVPNIFDFSLAPYTTVGAITPLPDETFTHWQVVKDSDVEPTTNWTAGTKINVHYDVTDTNPHKLYLWIKDDNNGGLVTQIKPASTDTRSDSATVPGLSIQATSPKVGPTSVTDLAVTKTSGSESTSLDVFFSAASAGSAAISFYQLVDPESGYIFDADISPGTTAIGGLQSDTIYSMQIRCHDANGLISDSNTQTVRTGLAAAGVIGIKAVSVRSLSDKLTGYYQEENAGVTPLTITLERTGGSSGAVSVLIRQIDKTALNGTNYTKTVENGTTNKVSWADGNTTDQDVDVSLLDDNMSTNLCFQFEIIKDSEAGGCTVDKDSYDWGRGDSVLCYINGSASASAGYVQQSTGDKLLVIPVTDLTHATINDGTTGSWGVEDAADPGMTESGKRLRPTAWGQPAGANDTTLATGADEVSVSWPCVFTQTGTHYMWVRMYHPTDGSTDELHVNVNDTGSGFYDAWADNTNDATLDGTNPRYKWVNLNNAQSVLSQSISAGTYPVKVHKYENTHHLDKILFTTSSSYDPTGVGGVATRGGNPSLDDNYGPPVSSYGGGASLVDDADNPAYPSAPGITALDPDSLIPLDGTSNVDVQRSEFTATFTGASNLINPVITIENNSTKATISGVTTVEGANLNIAKFTASQNFSSNTTYDVFLTAQSITDSSGNNRVVDFTSIGDWQFTTVNTGTEFIVHENFNSFTAPYTMTAVNNYDTDLHDIFLLKTWSPPAGDEYSVIGPAQGNLTVVEDPDGSVARGNCLRIRYKGGTQSHTAHMTCFPRFDYDNTNVPYPSLDSVGNPTDIVPNVSVTETKWDYTGGPPDTAAFATREAARTAGTEKAYDDLYIAYDLRLDDNWYYNFADKFPGLQGGTNLQGSHGPVAFGDGIYGQQATKLQLHGHSAFGNPDGAAQYYLYDCYYKQYSLFLRRDGNLPTSNAVDDYTPSGYHRFNSWQNCYVWPRGTWVTIEIRQKLNTAPSVLNSGFLADSVLESEYQNNGAVADGCLVDGIAEVWITDPRPVSSDPLTGGTGGAPIKMLKYVSMWRYHQGKKMDAVSFSTGTNAPRPDQPNNPTDQYAYIDNLRVSESPITHE